MVVCYNNPRKRIPVVGHGRTLDVSLNIEPTGFPDVGESVGRGHCRVLAYTAQRMELASFSYWDAFSKCDLELLVCPPCPPAGKQPRCCWAGAASAEVPASPCTPLWPQQDCSDQRPSVSRMGSPLKSPDRLEPP